MTIILGNGAAVLTPGDTANSEQLYRDSALSRFRESRRRRKNNQRLAVADNPLVYQPRAPRLPLQPPPAPSAREINPIMVRFLFEKELRNSDVSLAGRIVLPKKFAEMHLPSLNDKEGFWMHLDDMDFQEVWTFKYRFWPNHRSRMYIFENAREFTKRHSLELGDYIMVFKDDQAGSYLLRGRKRDDHSRSLQTTMNNSSNTNLPSSLDEYGDDATLNYAENDQYDYHDQEATPDYQRLISTPLCESLDLSPLTE